MSAADNWNLQWLQRQKAINGGPLPVVNDPNVAVPDPWGAWQGGRLSLPASTAIDTGPTQAGGSTQGGANAQDLWNQGVRSSTPLADLGQVNAPTQGSGVFGTTYTDPGGGWNPVSLLDARDNFDGTAVDGWYTAAVDKGTSWGAGEPPELDRARVWRWTMDDLKGDFSNQQLVNQTFLKNVARLKRDYMAPENAQRGLNWQNSGFAGYDRLAQGGQGGVGGAAQAAATSGQGRGRSDQPSYSGPGVIGTAASGGNSGGQQNQGGSNVNPLQPPMGSGLVTGGQSAGVTTQPGGSIRPATGGNGTFGGAGFANQADPESATRQYMMSHGADPDSNGFFGDFIRKLMGNLVPALMSLTLDGSGKPALDQLANLNGLLDPIFYGGAGTLGGNLAGFADKAQGGLRGAMGGLGADTQASLLRNLTALRTVGQNPYLASATNNRLDNSINAAKDYGFGLAQQGKTTPKEWNLGDWIMNRPGMANVLQGWR